jgi:trk system potassium uptake protein TrkA
MRYVMRQFAILGIRTFGFYLATHLYEKGHEVLAVDVNSKRVQMIKDRVSRAVVADATDRDAMEALGVDQMETVIICMGSSMSNSILATLNILDMGSGTVLATVHSEAHGRILKKIGAAGIFFPQKDLAISAGERLHNPNMLDYLPFAEGFSIAELPTPRQFIGKALHELDLINRYGIQVIGSRDVATGTLNMVPKAHFILKDKDILILLGSNEALDKLKEEK